MHSTKFSEEILKGGESEMIEGRNISKTVATAEMEIIVDREYCASSYLAYRYVAEDGIAWTPNWAPVFPHTEDGNLFDVADSKGISDTLRHLIESGFGNRRVGLLLSGGIDSAILASFLPEHTLAYTIHFDASSSVNEAADAQKYARVNHLRHKIVSVSWKDYERDMDTLMRRKRSPLHAVEVGLYKATRQAADDGIDALIVGNGADSTFGGLDKLLGRDWTYDEFVKRYTFIDPRNILKSSKPVERAFEKYKTSHGINVVGFLKSVHGAGITQAFKNSISAGGCTMIEPYERMRLSAPLDFTRIRNGESKYLLRELFKKLYPELGVPDKVPFARPMDEWLANWKGPTRREFRTDINLSAFTGDQKFLIYSLERFLNLMDGEAGLV